jgi:hypothetical protein
MLERDFESFSAMLEDVNAFYPTAKAPTPGQKAMFFRALSDLTIAQVRAGFDAHVRDAQRGRFAPLPADVIAQVEGHASRDTRPGPEEAWSIALQARDEDKTLVWTDEIAQAWGIAGEVRRLGDEVGARMAFKESYARLVAEARAAGKAAHWSATLGLNATERDQVLQQAHDRGLLPKPERLRELMAPDNAMSYSNRGMPADVRVKLEALRLKFATRQVDGEEEDVARNSGQFTQIQDHERPWNKPKEQA